MSRKLVVGLCLQALLGIASLAIADVRIEHSPPASASPGERIVLQALITDDGGAIEVARVYFRTPAAAGYLYVELIAAPDAAGRYTATLPAPSSAAQSIDYFLLARGAEGKIVKSQNFAIDVRAPARVAVSEPTEFANVGEFHGRLVRFTGDVTVVNLYGEPRAPANVGNVVRRSETVRTGSDGVAVLDFDNDPITVLDHDSELRVRTPTWFSHLAGKAYFAFQRLLGVADRQRSVNNTVALIGIRGTTFISYDGAQKGVALKDGTLQISRSRPRPIDLLRDGVATTTNEFTLGPERLALFDGARVTESAFTPEVLADFARLEAFAAGALGLPRTAEQPPVERQPLDVYSEAATLPGEAPGFSDTLALRPTPPEAVLGITATTETVVAGSGGTTSSAALSPWLLAGVGVGAAAIVSNAESSGGGGGSGDTNDGGTSLPGNFVAEVTVSCNACSVAFVDTNQIQDDYYDLYVNDQFVGPVNNVPGGTVRHNASFVSGANTMELRFRAVQCCNTQLQADFNNGEVITPFVGSTDHIWTVNAP